MTDRIQSRPPQPPQLIAKTLKYTEAQEHFLRRIASGLVLHWDALPDELQDIIVDQAAQVEDRDPAPHEPRDIENFVRGAKVVALSKTAPTAS
ncbi:MAG: hypothetical protein AB7O98_04550 [Hyphomonadaceae bacterium]